jgi:SAM-dependent methyltransferase
VSVLTGEGIEIGALHRPLPLPGSARATYVDRLPTAGLAAEYPELAGELVAVDVVDDAQRLAAFGDRSQDFVIARHVLELLEDPVGALGHWLRVLRPGGVVHLEIGDRRTGLDARRSPPTAEHLLADRADGGAGSRAGHYREWAELVDLPLGYVEPAGVAAHAAALERGQHAIHFHCWTRDELLAQLPALGLPAGAEPAGDATILLRPR